MAAKSAPSRPGTLEDLHLVDLDLHPNESSGLMPARSARLLESFGWHTAFWTVLDDGLVDHCIALVGRDSDAASPTAGWEIRRLRAHVTSQTAETEDCEAIARQGEWIYAFGSHYGSKSGPLQAKRHFVARFHEEDVTAPDDEGDPHVDLQVVETRFALHAMVNDALRTADVRLNALGPKARKRIVTRTRRQAIADGEDWFWRVRWDDLPVNIEGAAFRPDGAVLLGLRYPVTVDGHPLVVEVDGIEGLFEAGGEAPVVRGVWEVRGVGAPDELTGVRDLHIQGNVLHLLVGNIDATGVGSVLLEDHPEGAVARSAHWRVKLPAGRHGGALTATPVRSFDDLERVEGMAADEHGDFFYVSDEDDRVKTRFTSTSFG
ncbi:MAG: hypothetical protein M3N17_09010 [Actinomycetota bacterium]|nr:hypothetical protein [Actinomycetota bacterium]